MAARFRTKLYTFVGTDPVSLGSILASSNDAYVSSITLRAGASNVGVTTWKALGDTAGGYLEGGEAATFDLAGSFVALDQIYLVGSVDDTIYITVMN